MADTPKWTELLSAWSTFAQTAIVALALGVAYVQYLASLRGDRTQRTLDVSERIQRLSNVIDRISDHFDFREDWLTLATSLQKDDQNKDRIQCEEDLMVVANFFSEINTLFRGRLIDRALYLSQFDEFTIFIAAAVNGVRGMYQQPDYEGLYALALQCQEHYRRRNGKYEVLRTVDLRTPIDIEHSEVLGDLRNQLLVNAGVAFAYGAGI